MKKIHTVCATIAVTLFFSATVIAQSYDPAADLSQYKTASELYNYTQVLFVQIASPNQPNLYLMRGPISESLWKFDRAVKEFVRRYPNDPRETSLHAMVIDRDALKPALGLSASTSTGSDGKQVITTTTGSAPVGTKKTHAWPVVRAVEKLQRD